MNSGILVRKISRSALHSTKPQIQTLPERTGSDRRYQTVAFQRSKKTKRIQHFVTDRLRPMAAYHEDATFVALMSGPPNQHAIDLALFLFAKSVPVGSLIGWVRMIQARNNRKKQKLTFGCKSR